MVRNILAVLDGGPGDSSAHATAVRLARHGAETVRVMGLCDPRRRHRRELVPLGAWHYKMQADHRRYERLRSLVQARAERLAEACAVAGAETAITLGEGDPRTVLTRAWHTPDLIILGRERRGAGTASFSPKALIHLLHDSPRPVLVSCEAQSASPGTVAIGYDGSPKAELALRNFLRLGLATGRRLEVVCVDRDPGRVQLLAKEAAAVCDRYEVSYQTYSVPCRRQPLTVLANWLLALRPGTMVLSPEGAHGWRRFLFETPPLRRLMRGSAANLYMDH